MRNLLTLAVAVTIAAPVAAHHSDAGLDMQSLVTLDGTVVEYNWRSPHVYIVVDSLDEQGRTVRGSLQTSSTLTLARSGWTRDSLMPGEGVTFSAHPALDGRPTIKAWLRRRPTTSFPRKTRSPPASDGLFRG